MSHSFGMWDIAKGVLGKKFITTNTYIKNKKRYQYPNFTTKGTRNRIKPKDSRRKEIMKTKAEIKRKTIDKINKIKSWFFKMINKIGMIYQD